VHTKGYSKSIAYRYATAGHGVVGPHKCCKPEGKKAAGRARAAKKGKKVEQRRDRERDSLSHKPASLQVLQRDRSHNVFSKKCIGEKVKWKQAGRKVLNRIFVRTKTENLTEWR